MMLNDIDLTSAKVDDTLDDIEEENNTIHEAEVSFPNAEELRTSDTSRGGVSRGIGIFKNNNGKETPSLDGSTTINRSHCRCSTCCCIGTTMAMMTITIIVLASLLISVLNNNTAEIITPKSFIDIQSPNERPRPPIEDIIQFVVDTGVSSYESFQMHNNDPDITTYNDDDNKMSPQYRAVQWLMLDDPLNLPLPVFDLSSYDSYMYIVRYIMILNFFALNGPEWDYDELHFLSNHHVCDWNNYILSNDDDNLDTYNLGLFCEISVHGETDLFGQLQKIPIMLHLAGKMEGTIPTENGMLTSLESFAMNSNPYLFGTIPTELCQLTKLEIIRLYKNQLSGTIPDCFNNLQSLELLDVSLNELSGSIPESLCKTPVLDELFMEGNKLSGTIPSCIGRELSSLVQLKLSANSLQGTIPNELCLLGDLLSLDLSKNVFEGTIPNCIGTSMSLLEILNLSGNQLYGTIPDMLVLLKDTLEMLILDHNYLSGNPSDTLNQMHRLRILFLGNNEIEMTLDKSIFSQLINLERLDLSRNWIDGIFPTYFMDTSVYPGLLSLDIGANNITGTVDNIQMNNVLEMLSIYGNNLFGSIESLTNLTQLSYLDISENLFTGSMESVSQIRQLQHLYMGENPFQSGPIPDSFGLLADLESLSLRDTSRTGSLFDPKMDQWQGMRYLDFGSNNLEGTIPVAYGKLSRLLYLLLNDNPLINGTVPTVFTEMKQLMGVLLDGTSLSSSDSLDVLCTLPNFQENSTGFEVLIVDCIGQCDDRCSVCTCCDINSPNSNETCSKPLLSYNDAVLDEYFRQPSSFFTVTDQISVKFDDNRS